MLGEMSSDQLYETIMNREKRILKRITIADAEAAEQTIEDLMGRQVEPRRKFIQENAHKAKIVI